MRFAPAGVTWFDESIRRLRTAGKTTRDVAERDVRELAVLIRY